MTKTKTQKNTDDASNSQIQIDSRLQEASTSTTGTQNEKRSWTEEQRLQRMNEIFAIMDMACLKQPNISHNVKDRLPELIEHVDALKTALTQLREAQAANEEMEVSYIIPHGSTKRTRDDDTHDSENDFERRKPLKKNRTAEQEEQFTEVKSKKALRQDKKLQQKPQVSLQQLQIESKLLPKGQQQALQQTRQHQQPLQNKRLRPQLKQPQQTQTQRQKTPANPAASDAQEQPKKKRRRRRRPKKRSNAVLIRPSEGKSYADVIKNVRGELINQSSATIKGVRKTRAGDVLIEIGAAKELETFSAFVKRTVGEDGSVKNIRPKEVVEIRDLDCLATKEEVETAVKSLFAHTEEELGEFSVTLTNPNSRGLCLAIVEMDQEQAQSLLSKNRIRIGYTSCRMKSWQKVQRCFRCLSYGHQARNCEGPDRRNICYKCGIEGHKGAACKATDAQCILCTERNVDSAARNHIPGSGQCRVFRETLDRLKRQR